MFFRVIFKSERSQKVDFSSYLRGLNLGRPGLAVSGLMHGHWATVFFKENRLNMFETKKKTIHISVFYVFLCSISEEASMQIILKFFDRCPTSWIFFSVCSAVGCHQFSPQCRPELLFACRPSWTALNTEGRKQV